jgi:hypothetical protein
MALIAAADIPRANILNIAALRYKAGLYLLLKPWVDGMSIGELFTAAIWKNMTRGQHVGIAQSLPPFALSRVDFFHHCEPCAVAQRRANHAPTVCPSLG